jgi:peptide/nickel transport system permease protein
MLDVIHQDYLRTARAKGLPNHIVLYKHALRNALIPLITMLAIDLPYLLGGAVFVETIFSWPGMGRLYFTAAMDRDYPVLLAILILGAAAIILSNLLADIAYSLLDPRVRYS